MHICFVVEGYPTQKDPFMTFIRELVSEIACKGVKCSVIAPQSITRAKKHRLPVRPEFWQDCVKEDVFIDVYQPYYYTFSRYARRLGKWSMQRAAKKAFKKIEQPIDALYGHFWHMGAVAFKLDKELPLFVACGESKIEVFENYSARRIEGLKQRLTGVIYVGTKSLCESKELELQKDTSYIIAPNGYNADVFKPLDKTECRQKIGWDTDMFSVIFVGSFNKRKGTDRLSAALEQVNSDEGKPTVYSCFVGSGEVEPTCDNVLFKGKLGHEQIADYLNASDVFVLPTTAEGCCNAIVEAIGCHLPVISSDGMFNDDIIDETCSLRIDPMDTDSLADAIRKLRDDKTCCDNLKKGAGQRAEQLKIDVRAKNILQFIEEKIKRM